MYGFSNWKEINCFGVKKLSLCGLFFTLFGIVPCSGDLWAKNLKNTHGQKNKVSFSELSLKWTVASFNPYFPKRGPLSYVPSEEVLSVPYMHVSEKSLINEIFASDDAGVMNETVAQMKEWDRQESYAKQWNLEDTGLYSPVSVESKKEYILQKSVKYLDKRIQGESKKAKPGTTMATVGNVQNALRPSSEVGISEKIKIKFKAQMLEGDGRITLDNPYIDSYTEVKTNQDLASGKPISKVEEATIHLGKSFKDIGLKTSLDYSTMEGTYVASSTKEIGGGWESRVTTYQPEMGFDDSSEHKVELLFNAGF